MAAAIGRAVMEGAATKNDVNEAKLELRAEIEKLRSTLIMWFIGTIMTLAAIIIAVVKL